MALQGTLRDFGIADIFQLIAQQQKTGVLELRRSEGGLDVHFSSGLICAAVPSGKGTDEVLVEFLVRTGLLKPEIAPQLPGRAQEQLSRVRDYLVDSGLVPNQTVAEIEKLSALEAIYDLFSWQDGEFAFVQRDIKADDDSFQPISAEHVLMEGFRMVDEWPSIRRVIPDSNARIQKISTPQPTAATAKKKAQTPTDEFFDLGAELDDDDEGHEGGLSQEEQRVLEVARVGQSVQWVADRTRMGTFDATKAVADLVTKGYIKLDLMSAQIESATAFFEASEGAAGRTGKIVLGVAAAIAAVVLLGRFGAVARAFTAPLRLAAALEASEASLEAAHVERALEAYRLLNGDFPQTLRELAASDIAPEGVDLSSEASPYRYARTSNPLEGPRYHLERKAADAAPVPD